MSRKRPPSNARPALVRNDAAESPTWGGRVVRLLGALRQDGWRSTLGGLGSRADRGRPGSLEFIEQAPLTDYELTAAYRNLWLVRRLVEDPSNEALREGFGIEQDEIPEFMRLNYGGYHSEGAFERALRMAELKGGAGIYIGYGDVFSPEDALQPAPEGEAEVTFLETFDRFQLQGEQQDPDTHSPTFDQSQIWCVSGQRRAGMRFHTSRMIKFKGAPLAGDLGLAQQDREWGDSSLQAVWTDVQRYGVFWQSVAHLLQVSSVGVVSIDGLIAMLTSQNQDVARDRIELMNEAMSITRLFLLDASKGETYHREAVSFSDMPALLQEVQLATAGAFRRPVTKLFGRAPSGLNATGESDMRSWYDEVECYRERQVKPALRALLAITDGIKPDAIDFPPLWQPTEQEMAAARKVDNEADQVLWTIGAASAEEIRQARYEGKPLAELMKGPPPEEAGPVQQANAQQPEPDPNADPNADVSAEDVQAAGYSTDATDDWREDVTTAQVETRLAHAAIRRWRDDPDGLGEFAEEDVASTAKTLRAHIIRSVRESLPGVSDVRGKARKERLCEIRKLTVFKSVVDREIGDLARMSIKFNAENGKRAQGPFIEDPEYERPSTNTSRRLAGLPPLARGPRGGKYYVSAGGSRVYVHDGEADDVED